MITETIILHPDLVHSIKPEMAWHYRMVPAVSENGTSSFYLDEDGDEESVQSELEVLLNKPVLLTKIPAAEIDRLLNTYYFKDNRRPAESQAAKQLSYQGSQDFLQNLIAEARSLKSSDIHIEIYEQKCRVRIRIDGNLVERYQVPKNDYPAMVNKIKILGNLDIAEKRLPQDGRIQLKQDTGRLDIRVSVLPTLYGEKVVLRLLSNDATNINLDKLGFADIDLNRYKEGIRKPNGILLISGPTGSGKTTTLYATLKLLNKESRNVLTIEDPIEYTLDGINQVQLRENIGLGFASALRTFLRQDPDVIMVGEIRDTETANMAIRASLTGHLVLSTIHTNSAWGTVSRLLDMGIPSYLLSSTLNTTVAQRLVRCLCPACKKEEKLDRQLFPNAFQPFYPIETHYQATGCPDCYYTGYKGRTAIYEVLGIDWELSEAIKAGQMEVKNLLKEKSIRTLAENAFDLLAQGTTSLEEIYPLLINQ